MRKALVCVMVLALPAWALAGPVVDYFPVSLDGTWQCHDSEGYRNYGDGGPFKAWQWFDQQLAYLDWCDSVGDKTGMSLSDFIVSEAGLQHCELFLHFDGAIGENQVELRTLRTGNTGDMAKGDNSGGVYTAPANPGQCVAVAWSLGTGPMGFKGDIGTGGQAWITPSTREVGFQNHPGGDARPIGPNEEVLFGMFLNSGWDAEECFAVEWVLGYHWSTSGTNLARCAQAGQLANVDLFSNDDGVGGHEPRDKNGDGDVVINWYGVGLDAAIVEDLANNEENKGIVLSQWNANGLHDNAGNKYLDAMDQGGGPFEAYLVVVVPEPGTLSLLALGGLAMLRRRK